MQDRVPYDSKYCKEVKCQFRSGNNCTLDKCVRVGSEKWPAYFVKYDVLADGDEPDA